MDAHFDRRFVHAWGGGRGTLPQAGVPGCATGGRGGVHAADDHHGAGAVQ